VNTASASVSPERGGEGLINGKDEYEKKRNLFPMCYVLACTALWGLAACSP